MNLSSVKIEISQKYIDEIVSAKNDNVTSSNALMDANKKQVYSSIILGVAPIKTTQKTIKNFKEKK